MTAQYLARPQLRRRRALAHQCVECRRHWAMTVVEHPSGTVVVCRFCGTLGADLLRRPALHVV